jgi:hypothetical protein
MEKVRRYARNASILEADPTLGIASPTVAWHDAVFAAMGEFRSPEFAGRIRQPVLMLAASENRIGPCHCSVCLALAGGIASRDCGGEARNAAGRRLLSRGTLGRLRCLHGGIAKRLYSVMLLTQSLS